MSTDLTPERIAELRQLAEVLRDGMGLAGPWRWIGNTDTKSAHLVTARHGQRIVMGFTRWVRGAQPTFRVSGEGWARVVPAREIPVFEVCRSATSRDDPRVYRADLVGFRSPVADWLAALDPDTILALIDAATHQDGAR